MTDAKRNRGADAGRQTPRQGADPGVGRAGAAAAPATVREECKRRFGDKPCIKTSTETAEECRDWCPLLRKPTDLLVVVKVAA